MTLDDRPMVDTGHPRGGITRGIRARVESLSRTLGCAPYPLSARLRAPPLTAVESATPSLAPVLPVSLLVGSARLLIERHLGLAWISGEISGFTRAASGHCYFMLKDEQAQVRCVLFRHKAQLLGVVLRDGAAVESVRPRRSTRRAVNSSSMSRRSAWPASERSTSALPG